MKFLYSSDHSIGNQNQKGGLLRRLRCGILSHRPFCYIFQPVLILLRHIIDYDQINNLIKNKEI